VNNICNVDIGVQIEFELKSPQFDGLQAHRIAFFMISPYAYQSIF
jgi:hypothetical protein